MLRTSGALCGFVLALTLSMRLAHAQDAAAPPVPAPAPATGPAQPEPLVENPHYAAWAKFKPGTQVDYDLNTDVNGMAMTTNLTTTLTEMTPEKAVVQTAAKMNLPGIGAREEKQTHTFAAQVPKSEADRALLPMGATGEGKETGTETVQAAGKRYECKVGEFVGKVQGGETRGKTWRSDAVPGGLVKMESTSDSPKMTVKMELKKVTEK